ncbi:MAG: DivIVA domain-containing protein [candidate division Zixibacteria bacterium]|nr:DivIVA domain-containing protein [candidate division Zixibacteria bacterium]
MDLSPNDIRNCEFSNQMRGYDKEEVENYLDQVASTLEQVKQENLKLSMEAESLKSQLSGLKQFEDTIKGAAIDARRNADMTIATAKQEAEMIISKAKNESENILVSRTNDVSDIENQITKLGLTRKSYLSKIRVLIQSHLEMINDIETDNSQPAENTDAISITQSTDVTTEQRESLVNEPKPEEVDGEIEDASIADELKDVIRSDDSTESEPEAKEDQPIDPELAAALENYKKTTAEQSAPEVSTTPEITATTTRDAFVETTSRAEDIPNGFIAMDESSEEQATDKVPTSEPNTLSDADPNVLNTDEPDRSSTKPLEPENLAGELDEVVNKFEKAMDKADSQ